MRIALLLLAAVLAVGQQQPTYQANWPCTGKERSFDPAYSQISEATGGHLFLADKSETEAMGKLALGGLAHNATITRATAKLESFKEVRFPVDSTVESLFLVVSVQCLHVVDLYGPDGASVRPAQVPGGQENRYRAGWIATIPKPAPGPWTLRIAGQGYYSYAVEAKSGTTFGASFDPKTRRVTASGTLSLIGPEGEDLGDLGPELLVPAAVKSFRVRVRGMDAAGNPFERTERKLFSVP